MANILISPDKYVQGAKKMNNFEKYAEKYRKKALVIISSRHPGTGGSVIRGENACGRYFLGE